MLACARIGAPHSVVFAGFSSKCVSRLACTCVDSAWCLGWDDVRDAGGVGWMQDTHPCSWIPLGVVSVVVMILHRIAICDGNMLFGDCEDQS